MVLVLVKIKGAFKLSFFTVDQNVGVSLKCILTKIERFYDSRFTTFAVQNKQVSSHLSVTILQVQYLAKD